MIKGIIEHESEEMQRETERELNAKYLDLAEVLLIAVETDQTVSFVNRKGCEILEYPAEEILGKNWFENFLLEKDREQMKALFESRLSGEVKFIPNFEASILTRSGEKRMIEWHNSELKNEKGEIIRVIASGSDITERRRVEEELRTAERKYRGIFENAIEGIFRLTPDGIILDANPSLARMYGYNSPQEMINSLTHVKQLYADPEIREKWISIIEQNDHADFETQMCKKDGSTFWVFQSIRAVHSPEGQTIYYKGFSEDITNRKRSEENLRWKTALLEAQLNTSIDGILVVDENNKRIITNKRLIEFWNIPQYILEDEDDAALLNYAASIVKYPGEFIKKVNYLYDHPYETSFDEIKFKSGMVLDRYSAPVLDEKGHHYGRIWGFRDVTERKQAEEALKQSECLYRTIFENTGTATIVIEEDTTISLASTEYEKLSGYCKDEVEGKLSWTDAIFPEDLERMLTQHNLRRKDGSAALKQYEFRYVDRYGKIKNVAVCVDMIPGTKKSIASLLDITDRKHAEAILQESERRLADIIEFFPEATLIIDNDRKVVAWNRAMEAMTGIKVEEMLGKGDYEYAIPFHGQRRPILADLVLARSEKKKKQEYKDLRLGRHILYGEGIATNLSTGDRFCSATATVLYDSKGEAIAAIECVRDITEQKQIEARLNRAEKMEALGNLAGGVAHDLNNILGVMVGYSELLVEKLPDDSLLTKYAQQILQSSERGAAIIQDLLTMARRVVAVSEVVNLNKVVADYLKSPEHEKLMSHNRNLLVRTDLSDDLLNMKGSPIHLGKTIMNLISNAVEAISDLGTVTISTQNQYVDYAISGYDNVQEGEYVILAVSDTGKGMKTSDLGKIFEPFYTKKVMGSSGTGLGLAVVWGTVKDHHGYIEVKSDEGVGTTFTLYFPVTREELMRDQEKIDISSYMGLSETILVIDDMEFQRDLAETILSNLNYNVRAVPSGEAALDYLRSNEADLLLLDMIMDPGMDGLETFKKIKEIKPDQKAIIVSGFAETERVKTAQKLGAGEYVRKPYNLEKIGLAIRRELDRA